MDRLTKWRHGLLFATLAVLGLPAPAQPLLEASFDAQTSSVQLDFILSGESFSNVVTVDVQTLVFDTTALASRPLEQVLTSSPALGQLTYEFFDETSDPGFGGYAFLSTEPTIGPGLLFRWTFDVYAPAPRSLPFEVRIAVAGFDDSGVEYLEFRSAQTSLTVVPEPSTWTVFAAGLCLFAAAAVRRRRAQSRNPLRCPLSWKVVPCR